MELTAVILAAGKGTRMKSRLPKVLHKVAGRPMLEFVLEAAKEAGASRTIVVVGHEGEEVAAAVGDRAEIVWQREQLGTGHALLQAREALAGYEGDILVLPGDVPLVRGETLRSFWQLHRRKGVAATVLTTELEDPTGYGRIVRDAEGRLRRIVEHKDAAPAEREIKEVNTGIYCFRPVVFQVLPKIRPDNVQKEYYLTDAVDLLLREGLEVACFRGEDPEEFLGINDRRQLAEAEGIIRRRVAEKLMEAGVTILAPALTFIDPGVRVGADTVIYPFTFLEGETTVGESCVIGPWSRLKDAVLGREVVIEGGAVIIGARLEDGAKAGPFAYLRPGTVLRPGARVGTFVEVKNSVVGPESKVPHLSYIGDAEIGAKVNVGAGTITCNYDGERKWPTVIEDFAFIGSNTNLVAPVRVGRGAYVGAGSTITKDVPPDALGIARSRQVNIPDWAKKKRR
ncbi:bifunctional UDP-N-acetylglucosamine diphosphorylase/glucosamine-1-phosphate N-acetyltransferase GlmU [Ammonifex thiophilus]|uniref:Bifunctional protein GlmU n=1 Tax=Ammonifex thiophilus TaxID=444093 RepID=A0A3D8P7G0_9THEO|nr:bifunctional UDP-N-acetylglucosamine diphosphorylase/glucosamine-1-phosphate N-acetyltransferase GlmU [Ammonifex thiophilus]RDV84637.1 bifunctional UDP-N-acetylglucosamine diphosphorylase/glucosamine-1-phosphate N-acetyltransferase GlmU [Ammonifex thiophilus]